MILEVLQHLELPRDFVLRICECLHYDSPMYTNCEIGALIWLFAVIIGVPLVVFLWPGENQPGD
jgi:hypothetical protein